MPYIWDSDVKVRSPYLKAVDTEQQTLKKIEPIPVPVPVEYELVNAEDIKRGLKDLYRAKATPLNIQIKKQTGYISYRDVYGNINSFPISTRIRPVM